MCFFFPCRNRKGLVGWPAGWLAGWACNFWREREREEKGEREKKIDEEIQLIASFLFSMRRHLACTLTHSTRFPAKKKKMPVFLGVR